MGGRVTRLDLATDLYDTPVDYHNLYEQLDAGNARTAARDWRLVQSRTGATVYVGSRHSERFLRLYDKGKKDLNGKRLWARAELEIKGTTARGVAKWLILHGLESGMGVIGAFIDFNTVTWSYWMQQEAPVVISSTQTRSDTTAWLLGAVAKTLAREIEKDDSILELFIDAVESQLSEPYLRRTWGMGDAKAE